MEPVYLDYNATTPIHPVVLEAMRPYLEMHFGNPSSGHAYGQRARRGVEKAREQVAELLGCAPDEIVFTGGGTEANNMAILGAARAQQERGTHVITSAVEHPAVAEVVRHLARHDFATTVLPVDATGQVDPEAAQAALTPATTLVTIMHANNETGTLMPIADIAGRARDRGILVHTDAAQSVGKVPVRVDDLCVDLLSVAGHKLYAPKGVGVLYVRRGVVLEKLMHGGAHERNLRPGTENVPHIVGLGAACALAAQTLERRQAHMRSLRDRLHHALESGLPAGATRLNGHPEQRLPNTLNLSFRDVEAGVLLDRLQDQLAASAGAACHADTADSSVLGAMGVPPAWAMGAVRFSTGLLLTPPQVDHAAAAVLAALEQLRPAP